MCTVSTCPNNAHFTFLRALGVIAAFPLLLLSARVTVDASERGSVHASVSVVVCKKTVDLAQVPDSGTEKVIGATCDDILGQHGHM